MKTKHITKYLLCFSMLTGLSMGQAFAHEDDRPMRGMGANMMNTEICKGKKIGSTVESQRGDRTMKGQCVLGFVANAAAKPNQTQDREKMRAVRESQNKACAKFKVGQTVNMTYQGQKLAGRCELVFQPQR